MILSAIFRKVSLERLSSPEQLLTTLVLALCSQATRRAA